jgi:hypothetical protein
MLEFLEGECLRRAGLLLLQVSQRFLHRLRAGRHLRMFVCLYGYVCMYVCMLITSVSGYAATEKPLHSERL